MNPRAGYLLRELQKRLGCFPLKPLENGLDFCFRKEGQVRHLSDEVVRPTIMMVSGLNAEVLLLVNQEKRKRKI